MKQVKLLLKTDPLWVRVVLDNFDEFLADHADCERKASAMAMKLVAKYSDRTHITQPLIDLAIEELSHFKEVYGIMVKRNVPLSDGFIDDPYVNQLLRLLRHGRDERFLDQLLMLSIIESRGAERFGIIAEALDEPMLKKFYHRFYVSETKHGSLYVRLASKYFKEDALKKRLDILLEGEAQIIQGLKWRPSLH